MRSFSYGLLFTMTVSLASAGPATDRANSVFGSVQGQFSSPSAISNNLQKPLVGQNGQMATLNGESQFSTQVMCNATNNYLTVSGSVNSIGETDLTVQFDTNMDGTPDTNQVFNGISGYCQNGYVSCDPGTWQNCSYAMWQMDQTGLYDVEVPLSNAHLLKDCGCANASCLPVPQDHLIDNIKRFGAAIANTAQKYDPFYIISDVESTSTSTRYFGQNVKACKVGPEANVNNYLSNPTNMSSDGLSVAQNNSAYQMVVGSATLNKYRTDEAINCSVTRNIQVSEIKVVRSLSFRMYSQGRDYVRCRVNFGSGETSCSTDGTRYRTQLTNTIDQSSFCASNSNIWLASSSWWYNPPTSSGRLDNTVNLTTHSFPTCDNNLIADLEIRDRSNSNDTDYYNARQFTYHYEDCHLDESIDNQCASMEADPNCELITERVDGIETVLNASATGNTVPPQTLLKNGSTCSTTVTRDFFKKDRTYKCTTSNIPVALDTSHFQKPVVTEDGAQVTINTSSGPAVLGITNPAPSTPQCIQSCKVSSTVLDVSVNQSGIASDARTDPTKTSEYLKQCTTDNQCPLSDNETLINSCTCTNEFENAIVALQMLRLAGKDLECADSSQSVEECLGNIEVFKGREASCRTAGTQTAFKNCCNLDGKIFQEQYGNRMESAGEALSSMAETFDSLTGGNTQEIIDAFNEINSTTTGYLVEDATAQVMNYLFSPCAEDSGPAALVSSDMCLKIGEPCIEDWELAGCVQRAEVYCCFKSVLARILHEQGRQQFPDFTFGDENHPNCRGFTLDEFQAIDFSKIDFSDLRETIKQQSQEVIEQNMQQGMQKLQGAL